MVNNYSMIKYNNRINKIRKWFDNKGDGRDFIDYLVYFINLGVLKC